MKIAVLGTGMVGQAHAGKLAQLGHDVTIGTHDVKKALERQEGGRMTEAFGEWIKRHKPVKVATFAEAAGPAQLVIEAISGDGALEILKSIKDQIGGKILVDISNPLDFSHGSPPSLFVSNTDSLAERIQKALPDAKVVKAFNTTNAAVQTEPQAVGGGDHHLFIAGDDAEAKAEVTKIAKDWYGWRYVIDLGDIKAARGMEMVLPLWAEIFRVLGTGKFNFKIVQ